MSQNTGFVSSISRRTISNGFSVYLHAGTQLNAFIQFAEGVQGGFPPSADRHTRATLQQRSSLGGARPKCTLIQDDRLIMAKPRDRHDIYDIPSLEYACMSFAASKGMHVAGVHLHKGRVNTLLVDRFDRIANSGGDLPVCQCSVV